MKLWVKMRYNNSLKINNNNNNKTRFFKYLDCSQMVEFSTRSV